jgi:hypothetical protein
VLHQQAFRASCGCPWTLVWPSQSKFLELHHKSEKCQGKRSDCARKDSLEIRQWSVCEAQERLAWNRAHREWIPFGCRSLISELNRLSFNDGDQLVLSYDNPFGWMDLSKSAVSQMWNQIMRESNWKDFVE